MLIPYKSCANPERERERERCAHNPSLRPYQPLSDPSLNPLFTHQRLQVLLKFHYIFPQCFAYPVVKLETTLTKMSGSSYVNYPFHLKLTRKYKCTKHALFVSGFLANIQGTLWRFDWASNGAIAQYILYGKQSKTATFESMQARVFKKVTSDRLLHVSVSRAQDPELEKRYQLAPVILHDRGHRSVFKNTETQISHFIDLEALHKTCLPYTVLQLMQFTFSPIPIRCSDRSDL